MINPVYIKGKSPVWRLGDQKVVAWKTDLPVFNVSIWQQSPLGGSAYSRGNVYAQINEKDPVSNFTWTVQLYGFDLDYSPTFFFWVNPSGPSGFPSAYFNITRRSSTETTTASISSPTIPLNSTLASSSDSSNTAASPTDQPPGLTMTAKLALGLGVGIGVPILVTMAALVWLRARQLKASHQAAASMVASHGTEMQQQQGSSMHISEIHGTDPTGFCQELPQVASGKPLRPELPDQRYD
ncbi:unnamed protein product [Penicillium egyptiacum]|uniref:Mid2 domain-containing protein n=1 Tax=Penicillium egyptiacum TaxID=1303716 RepID=A0A9W4KHS6_9EURO|nr:unnamed protein product [Penicillium egyptiacum]